MINYFNKTTKALLKCIFLSFLLMYGINVLAVGQYVEENFSAKDRPSVKSVDYPNQNTLPSLVDIQSYCGFTQPGGPVIYAKAYHAVTSAGAHSAGIKCFSDYNTPGYTSNIGNCPQCGCTAGLESPSPLGYNLMEYRCAAVKAEVTAVSNTSSQCDVVINGVVNTTILAAV